MDNKKDLISRYLEEIASKLDITETMRSKAISSYNAVGKELGGIDNSLKVKIMPQGSFYLGTVIKPVSDKDEYDIDLVCLIDNMNEYSEYQIKNCVGDRLKNSSRYAPMLEEEGKRCWTLQYDEFHMDILPCVSNEYRYIEPNFTEIKLTHKITDNCYIPKYSNPYKYHQWFEERMQEQVNKAREKMVVMNSAEIKNVPLYEVKTTLQMAIQLLKRHRDIMYDKLPSGRKDNSPISIIITTLAAKAYKNEENLYDAIENIVNHMEEYIYQENGKFIIENPVMQSENFADKWNENPEKAKEFYLWINKARKDFNELLSESNGLPHFINRIEDAFGKNIVQRAVVNIGESTRVAREKNSLYVEGLTGGLKTSSSENTKRVGVHTFFGK